MPTGNQEYIRDMNRTLVLEAIINHAPLSRADLSKMLHLTKATISNIVQELIDKELVLELGSGDAPMGFRREKDLCHDQRSSGLRLRSA